VIRLLRNRENGAVVEWSPERAGNKKYDELTEVESLGYLGNVAAKSGRALSFDPKENGITLYTTSMGIGDAICVLYAACGLAEAGYKVTYNARHYKWVKWAGHPNLTLRELPKDETCGGVDVNQDYMEQLAEGFRGTLKSRPHWALRAIRVQYPSVPVSIEPARPRSVDKPAPVDSGKYIVLSPYSSCVGPARDWPAANYARLVNELTKEGHRVYVALTSEHKHDAWMYHPAKVWIDAKPEDMCSLVAHAHLLVANDSGMSHLGGLFGTPTFAIMAHIEPETTFWCADSVQGIVPDERVWCRFCSWQKEGGHLRSCQAFCGALASILPDDVLFQLRKRGSI
jgi:ADP-heptose:LPS heptosyltransferase